MNIKNSNYNQAYPFWMLDKLTIGAKIARCALDEHKWIIRPSIIESDQIQ